MIKLKEPIFRFVIPVEKHISKKNDKVIRMNPISGKRYIGTGTKTANEIKHINSVILRQLEEMGRENPQYSEPIHLKVLFHYPDVVFRKRKTMPDIMRKTKKVIDLSNLIQGVEDCLQDCGVIKDDKQIESYDGTRRIYGKSECFLIEVFIYKFEENDG